MKEKFSINCRGNIMLLAPPKVMGILNITPDSFFDGGKFKVKEHILRKVKSMKEEGADIIDVGGHSTRPGADEVMPGEELDRVIPVIEMIMENVPGAVVSVDTFRAKVAEEAIKAGASIINDVSAGEDDEMASVVKKYNVPYIIMHKKGAFKDMQLNPHYEDVLIEVMQFFAEKLHYLKLTGIHDIIIDPGFGFGKSLGHNFQLLKHLDKLKYLELPIMIGLSRKSMINKILKTKPEEALHGTIALNTLALLNGADIIRVHDVLPAVQTIKLLQFYHGIAV